MEENKKYKGKRKKTFIIVGLIIVFILSNFMFFYIGNLFAFNGLSLISVSEDVAKDISEIKDVKKYELLFQVRDALLTKYDGELDDNSLLEAAIKGMTQSVNDPYTVFMNASEYKAFEDQIEGHFVGIGAQLGIKDDKITVVSPIEGSPAEKAGLKAGDVILKVDGNEITEPNLDKTIATIRGEKGQEVTLTVLREGSEYLDISIVRDEIKVVSVKGEIIDGNIGYIQISSFDEDVAKDFKNKIVELKSQGMKGMILDLRGNPGGSLSEAVNVASQFIPKGKVVTYTIDKYDKKQEAKSVGGEAEGMPLVILIDGGSASASEVVTGALRDYEAGTIIGTTSFGKGIVQQLIEFKDGNGGLKVTTSKYYTPNGENIHKIGIKPDIEVEIPKDILEKEYDRSIDPQFNKGLEVIKEKIK
ncbi:MULTISPECIES: S41 family peptidase [unclassified Clostridium]|jgi:peptidase, S41 family|uniref:S41 family peptidase n=1 Tax=unclassified Clostridium TaxID=2614128 RepID=UPI0025C049BF|nr:S41 family peptidase [Clostridium sp.]MCI6693877.1 S41 family peptidase [Clostridium sp.]MDY2631473.1 S41 family peptidase [Clostridium sp.]MDY4253587.1 S41 family peptidase [Clostridium sp.]MDY6226066.1 S41 family peptidase [Clostridium sp.]